MQVCKYASAQVRSAQVRKCASAQVGDYLRKCASICAGTCAQGRNYAIAQVLKCAIM